MAEGVASSRNNGTTAFSSSRQTPSPLRKRTLARATTLADITSPMERRRGSFVTSDGGERQSLRSSTDELLLPRAARLGAHHEEPSHLHSAPLFLALLPAVGGMMFKNGSAIMTDVTLLLLAAIFLNWSVRLPWDWYYSAQSVRTADEEPTDSYFPPSDTIVEEPGEDDVNSSKTTPTQESKSPPNPAAKSRGQQADAASELRVHELLALFSCFLCPMLGAWLLHAIRSSLSRPSEGLVSDYNLSIFLLAAEVRPLSHLLKLVQAHTLHLQRIVAVNPHATPPAELAVLPEIRTRLDELEAHVASTTTSPPVPDAANPDLIAAIRKVVQPDLDAITRAIRRYEKRATVLGMQTDARMQDLEARVKDSLTLAAAAERKNTERKGSAMALLNFACACVVVPARTLWAILTSAAAMPAVVYSSSMRWLEEFAESFVRKAKGRKGPAKDKERERERDGGVRRKRKE